MGWELGNAALAAALDRPISVIHAHGQIYTFNLEGRFPDLWLYCSPDPGHYETLQVPKDLVLSLRTKAGGCTKSASSVLGGCTVTSVQSASPGRSLGGHTCGSVGGQFAKRKLPSCKTDDFSAEPSRQKFSKVSGNDVARIADVDNVHPEFSWSCGICGLELFDSSFTKLGKRRAWKRRKEAECQPEG